MSATNELFSPSAADQFRADLIIQEDPWAIACQPYDGGRGIAMFQAGQRIVLVGADRLRALADSLNKTADMIDRGELAAYLNIRK